ncbi:hypothetical protein AAFF_G00389830 [Aldrovandia affinis]|uniref:Uncharacterized protein n=1 Tax=Aldrovandia affinis TaxID=143900 RepID=A0AAD7SEF0_9TELE|nr:hypothetical protein AAFF_G00389830 [Aldrovandia affinis]
MSSSKAGTVVKRTDRVGLGTVVKGLQRVHQGRWTSGETHRSATVSERHGGMKVPHGVGPERDSYNPELMGNVDESGAVVSALVNGVTPAGARQVIGECWHRAALLCSPGKSVCVRPSCLESFKGGAGEMPRGGGRDEETPPCNNVLTLPCLLLSP